MEQGRSEPGPRTQMGEPGCLAACFACATTALLGCVYCSGLFLALTALSTPPPPPPQALPTEQLPGMALSVEAEVCVCVCVGGGLCWSGSGGGGAGGHAYWTAPGGIRTHAPSVEYPVRYVLSDRGTRARVHIHTCAHPRGATLCSAAPARRLRRSCASSRRRRPLATLPSR
jgi:hypothetical protein